jgi:hypothetical protein
MEDRSDIEEELEKAQQHEALKQALLRLLDDPQVQQKSSLYCALESAEIQRDNGPRRSCLKKAPPQITR